MIHLSSPGRTYFLRVIGPRIVILGLLAGMICYYWAFHDPDALQFLLGLVLLIPSIGLKEISFDNTRIVISSRKHSEEFNFIDLDSIRFINGFFQRYQLKLTMKDGVVKTFSYMPIANEVHYWYREPKGHHLELMEKWKAFILTMNEKRS